jgi:putative salt-induced outer membrane protein
MFSAIIFSMFQGAFAAEFNNESEAGIAVAAGNTESQNYNLKQSNSYQVGADTFKFDGRFLNAFADKEESARYLSGSLRYERSLNDMFSIYVSQGFESDKFAGYYLRHLNDVGGKYNFVKTETFYWLFEAGYRYTNEKFNDGKHEYKNSIRTYTETEKKWNPNVSTKYYVEYIPNLKMGKDYQINTELSLSAALTSVFSIKSAYLLRYDHLPAIGSATTDTLLTTALVAKF